MDLEAAPNTPFQSLEDDQIVPNTSVQHTSIPVSSCVTTSIQTSTIVTSSANIYIPVSQVPTKANDTTPPISCTPSPIVRSSIPCYSSTIKPISPKNSPNVSSTVSTTLTKELKLTTITTVTLETTTIRTPPISRSAPSTEEEGTNKDQEQVRFMDFVALVCT